LFKYAEKVVTGTFHGTVFSIKYDRDVVCYPTEKNRINKIFSLLADMGISDRLLPVGEEERFINLLDSKTDYEYAHSYIKQKQDEACRFLCEE
jgi:hypothetical protein